MEPVSIAVGASVLAAPIVRGLRTFWGWLTGHPTSTAKYALGLIGQVAPLPAGWERWGGARPELRGAPTNSVLAVPGLVGQPSEVIACLLDIAEELGIPVDSLATVIGHESGWDPKAKNPLGAFGLIQLTKGANLPPYTDPVTLASVATMTAADQLRTVALPYFLRQKGAKGADVGHLAMLNFLPAFADKEESYVLAKEGENVYQANAALDRAKKGSITVGDVYESFAETARAAHGRRIAVDGTTFGGSAMTSPSSTSSSSATPPKITVIPNTAPKASPPKASPKALPAPSSAPSGGAQYSGGAGGGGEPPPAEIYGASPGQLAAPAQKRPADSGDSGGSGDSGDSAEEADRMQQARDFAAEIMAGCACDAPDADALPRADADVFRPRVRAAGSTVHGILLAAVRAGEHRPISKVEIELPEQDLVVTMLRDALQARVNGRWLRLGVTYNEQVEIARILGMISPTHEMVTAAWEAAKAANRIIQPMPLRRSDSDDALLDSIEFAIRHNDNIEKAIARAGYGPDDFVEPKGKAWCVHPLQVEPWHRDGKVRGVVEFGWFQMNGQSLQPLSSGGHDGDYTDYSMVAGNLVERRARRLSTGETVDLVDVYLEWMGVDEKMIPIIERYR